MLTFIDSATGEEIFNPLFDPETTSYYTQAIRIFDALNELQEKEFCRIIGLDKLDTTIPKKKIINQYLYRDGLSKSGVYKPTAMTATIYVLLQIMQMQPNTVLPHFMDILNTIESGNDPNSLPPNPSPVKLGHKSVSQEIEDFLLLTLIGDTEKVQDSRPKKLLKEYIKGEKRFPITFEKSIFYDMLGCLGSSFIPANVEADRCTVTFTLTNEQKSQLENLKEDYKLYLVSCCVDGFYESKTNQAPGILQLTLNGEKLSYVNAKKNEGSEVNPIDLTPYIDQIKESNNILEVDHIACPENYFVAVHIVKGASAENIYQSLISKNAKIRKETTISNFKQENPSGKEKVSTKCPLSGEKIKHPVRSIFCPHLQAFDGVEYVKSEKEKRSHKCPVCNLPIPYDSLSSCELFEDILKDTSEQGTEKTDFFVSIDQDDNEIITPQ